MKGEYLDLDDSHIERKMNEKVILKQIDSFEKQFDKTIQEFKSLLKTVKQELKNSTKNK